MKTLLILIILATAALVTAAGNSGCDGTTAQLTGPKGEFGTNGFLYDNYMSCSWKISVSAGQVSGCWQ